MLRSRLYNDFQLYKISYEKNPVRCIICYIIGYMTNFCYRTGYISKSSKKLYSKLYMLLGNQTLCWDVIYNSF